MPIINSQENQIIVEETINEVLVSTVGAQGPRGKTILNGNGAPAPLLGLEGDFYYDKTTTKFYGPKLNNTSWDDATSYFLSTGTLAYSWELAAVQTAANGTKFVRITHNLGYHPNVTVKVSTGDVLETGIDYNSINEITLTMAQPFSGTAYLS